MSNFLESSKLIFWNDGIVAISGNTIHYIAPDIKDNAKMYHASHITDILLLADNTFASGSEDGTIKIWNEYFERVKRITLAVSSNAGTPNHEFSFGPALPASTQDYPVKLCLPSDGGLAVATKMGHVMIFNKDYECCRSMPTGKALRDMVLIRDHIIVITKKGKVMVINETKDCCRYLDHVGVESAHKTHHGFLVTRCNIYTKIWDWNFDFIECLMMHEDASLLQVMGDRLAYLHKNRCIKFLI